MSAALRDTGWAKFPYDPGVAVWARAALEAALPRVSDPDEQAKWLQCEGTWFVGVDTLPNDTAGAVGASGALCGPAYAAACELYGPLPLHPAQVSITYPGYPKPREGESETAFRYRLRRDAAHVDGLLAVGPGRRRMLKEWHAYILGLPLTDCSADASPLVVWEGSHNIMARAFGTALRDHPQADWPDIDLTETYQLARRKVFDTCRRIEVSAKPGEAYLVHRHALHGVAPWGAKAKAPPEGRIIAYFRPEFPAGSTDWLDAD